MAATHVQPDAVLFVVPETREGRATERDVADAARRIMQALTGGVLPSVTSDERILRATGYIEAHLDRPLPRDVPVVGGTPPRSAHALSPFVQSATTRGA